MSSCLHLRLIGFQSFDELTHDSPLTLPPTPWSNFFTHSSSLILNQLSRLALEIPTSTQLLTSLLLTLPLNFSSHGLSYNVTALFSKKVKDEVIVIENARRKKMTTVYAKLEQFCPFKNVKTHGAFIIINFLLIMFMVTVIIFDL